jgi:hypothetical protein
MGKHKTDIPHINNSGMYRLPSNVFLAIDDDPRAPFQVAFYEFELQELAEEHQDWNLFVKEE